MDSSLSLKLLEKNPSSFIHYSLYVKIYQLVDSLLMTYLFLKVTLFQCLGHKRVIGNEKADWVASKAALLSYPAVGIISTLFVSFASSKKLTDEFIYYWESYKNKPSLYLLGFLACLKPTVKVKSYLKDLLHNYPLCSCFVCLATGHCFIGSYYKQIGRAHV